MDALDWIEKNLLALLGVVVVPLFIVWLRTRPTIADIATNLSKDEATFRADLISRVVALTARCDELHEQYLNCERQHNVAKLNVSRLEGEIAALKKRRT